MSLEGATREIGDRIQVTMTMPGGYSSQDFEIWKLEHNTFKNITTRVTARNAGGDILTPFRLDDSVFGLLDKNYNPLY